MAWESAPNPLVNRWLDVVRLWRYIGIYLNIDQADGIASGKLKGMMTMRKSCASRARSRAEFIAFRLQFTALIRVSISCQMATPAQEMPGRIALVSGI